MDRGEVVFEVERGVAFQEIDAAGVVFFATFFGYFHDAYAAWLASVGVPLPGVLREGAWIAPLVHADADYKHPLHFGDVCTVAIASAELGAHSMSVRYEVRSKPARLHATGSTVHAFLDRASRRPRPPPTELVRALTGAGKTGEIP